MSIFKKNFETKLTNKKMKVNDDNRISKAILFLNTDFLFKNRFLNNMLILLLFNFLNIFFFDFDIFGLFDIKCRYLILFVDFIIDEL